MLERAGAGFWDVFTLRLRPLAFAETAASTIKLVDPKFRGEVGKGILADPGGFVAEVAGGLLGGYAFEKGIRYTKTKYQAFKKARFESKYPIEDFLPYEQEYITPQPTQEIDIRSSAFEEIAKPVIWEYRGGRKPTIPIDQRLPLKKYPDPSRIEAMGGKAISQLLTLEEISKARTIIEPTWIPGLRISDVGPTISKALPHISPYISGLLSTAHALEKARKEKIRDPTIQIEKGQQDIGITSLQVFKPIGKTRRRQREPTLPEYIVGPTPIEEQIQPVLPGYIQEPITRIKTRIKTIQEPKPILEAPPIQITRAIPTIPRIEEVTDKQGPPKFRPELKRKKGIEFLDLLRIGEIREYKVKLPKELLKGL